jgi:hypothetical protein
MGTDGKQDCYPFNTWYSGLGWLGSLGGEVVGGLKEFSSEILFTIQSFTCEELKGLGYLVWHATMQIVGISSHLNKRHLGTLRASVFPCNGERSSGNV